jgi:hypothetical protein
MDKILIEQITKKTKIEQTLTNCSYVFPAYINIADDSVICMGPCDSLNDGNFYCPNGNCYTQILQKDGTYGWWDCDCREDTEFRIFDCIECSAYASYCRFLHN